MNHLQNLIDNATAILAARQELIDNNWVAYRDVDSETQGFWLKKSGENGWEYIGVHLRDGRGVSVNLNIYCCAREHKGMVLELIRVYGTSMTLKQVLDELDYQLDKYENLIMTKRTEVLTMNRADMQDFLAREALKNANGNVAQAAEALWVSRATMYRKKKEIEQ